jgi:uncharacterized repeat protein (TIGR03806 family)
LRPVAGIGIVRRMPPRRYIRKGPATAGALARAMAVFLYMAGSAAAAPARPPAVPYLGMPLDSDLASESKVELAEAFPGVGFDNPVFMIAEPASDRIWIAEQAGRLVSFEAVPGVSETRVVLDLSDVTLGEGDSGLLSMAFHPRYAEDGAPGEGMIFVAYEHRASDSSLTFRVTRFHVDRSTGIADPLSETVLIRQSDQNPWHEGAAMLFRPSDGYLYVTVGDEGGNRCGFLNCQKIDKDLFSGVLRIDVDSIGGDTSHAPPRQPLTGATDHYFIPKDNPFVGQAGALEEFYAIGLRSPHRMTLDPVEDRIWIADVGQSAREEIDVLAPAANFQWSVMEGTVPLTDGLPMPDPVIGVWTPPIHDYGRIDGGTIIGGYVYRGLAIPSLAGRYVYGDFLTGRVWALGYTDVGGNVAMTGNERILTTSLAGRVDGLTSFGVDHAGELYLLTLGEQVRLLKIVPTSPDPGNVPLTLSATGLFEDLATLTAIDSLVPYDVKVPLWSDGAAKKRWVSVPTGTLVDYSPDGAWKFPAGTVFVKHFEIQLDKGDPASVRRLETRVLVVKEGGGVYGVTYKWRDDESDADLLVTSELEDLEVVDEEGAASIQRYLYPAPADCLACHAGGAGSVLGLRARQLEGMPAGEPEAADALEWFAAAGYFDAGADELGREEIPAFAPLHDDSAPLELRARSYLDVNCSHCHGGQDLSRAVWDARITVPLNHQNIVMGPLLGGGGDDERIVVPGDLERSMMHRRTATTDPELRMPPLARSVEDESFVAVLEGWILGMTATTLPPVVCGDSAAPWNTVSTADALAVLRTAVALDYCAACLCDVNDDASIGASDALRVLRHAVGTGNPLTCPAC